MRSNIRRTTAVPVGPASVSLARTLRRSRVDLVVSGLTADDAVLNTSSILDVSKR